MGRELQALEIDTAAELAQSSDDESIDTQARPDGTAQGASESVAGAPSNQDSAMDTEVYERPVGIGVMAPSAHTGGKLTLDYVDRPHSPLRCHSITTYMQWKCSSLDPHFWGP